MSQQSVSLLEQKDTIDAATIERICVILGVPEEVILNMTDEGLVNIFSNTFENSTVNAANHNCTFNPLDKLMATIEENKKLYERLLASAGEGGDVDEIGGGEEVGSFLFLGYLLDAFGACFGGILFVEYS